MKIADLGRAKQIASRHFHEFATDRRAFSGQGVSERVRVRKADISAAIDVKQDRLRGQSPALAKAVGQGDQVFDVVSQLAVGHGWRQQGGLSDSRCIAFRR